MDDSQLKRIFEEFLEGFSSLCISTMDGEGWPSISYAPFVVDENRSYYVFLSDLAKHTSCLRESGKASVMFIEDEVTSKQIFARTRVVFQCDVMEMKPSSESTVQMEMMQSRFGELMSTLRSLPDFHLFRLKPLGGSFVIGFGKAYTISGEKMDLLEHVKIKKNL